MIMISLVSRALVCWCLPVLAVGRLAANEPAMPPPNVVVILADDVGWGDPSCYGATKVPTPNLDRLARDGRRFVNGHASAAVCTPTRYSMLTGQYSWRRSGAELDKGVSNGASPLLIPTEMPTLPALLRSAGYRTAVIGKWHLGFGVEKPDYNRELRPGPLEIGFHEFFGLPATNDRIPTVLIRDHRVVGLDPADPIDYTYDKEEAKARGLGAFAAGRNRIGWAKGGKSAWWKDIDLADTFTAAALRFIGDNRTKPFFLYFAPHDVHAPIIPHPRFVGKSGHTRRTDMLLELDASVGQVLDTLDHHGLAENTLVIFSSDNGAYISDEDGHRPNGPYRGIKSQLWEGGHRVPFLCRWPARIRAGVADDLVSTLDIPATACAAAAVALPAGALPDSFNLLPSMLGEKDAPRRDHLIVMSGTGQLAVREGNWKYIPDLTQANGWQGGGKKSPGSKPRPGLFDLSRDPGEKENLHDQRPVEARRLAARLANARSSPATRPGATGSPDSKH